MSPKNDQSIICFDKEETLVDIFEKDLLRDEYGKFTFTVREVDCWQGRADLVKVSIMSEVQITREQAKAISQLTNARILSNLHYNAPRTINTIVIKTGLSMNTVKKSIKELLNYEIVSTNKNGNYVIHPDFKIPKIQFDAYEAKLKNWKRALYQSIQYRGFSHTSTVVMPEENINNALLNKFLFEVNGIGLISVTKNGKQIKHITAKKNQPRNKTFHIVGIGKVLAEKL